MRPFVATCFRFPIGSKSIRVVVYDHTFQGNRAWFRFAFKWTDTNTGEARSRAWSMSSVTSVGDQAVYG
jgi:hypothetical protein